MALQHSEWKPASPSPHALLGCWEFATAAGSVVGCSANAGSAPSGAKERGAEGGQGSWEF